MASPEITAKFAASLPVEEDPLYGCWRWLGAKTRHGYPLLAHGGFAHRAAYANLVGPIPAGHDVDHRCRRRDCVNPQHLEAVTKSENMRRRKWGRRVQQRKCKNGHDLYLHGIRTPEGGRLCRECDV